MELEHLGRCPVCAASQREPAYLQTEDGVFGTPGKWDYWTCRCGVLYLDPRPSRHALGAAYATYYTHHGADRCLLWRVPGWKGALRRGYLNGRYGFRLERASPLGALGWRFRRTAVRSLGFNIRHLPPPNSGSRILDVGCGNGDFLEVAQDIGFSAVGLDPDPRAVEIALARGFDVRLGTLPDSGERPGSFDHVLLNHVVEHLHDPVAALLEIMSLLAPGGRLWLSQPNLGALGLRKFGRHWRGLEPPRHLALFEAPRLVELLEELGFKRVQLLEPEDYAARFYFRQSQAIACGMDPYGERDPPDWSSVRRSAVLADRRARAEPHLAESLTITAHRPA